MHRIWKTINASFVNVTLIPAVESDVANIAAGAAVALS